MTVPVQTRPHRSILPRAHRGEHRSRSRIHPRWLPTWRSTIHLLLRLTLAYVCLLLLWQPFGGFYREFLIKAGNTISQLVFGDDVVAFADYRRLANAPALPTIDVAVLLALNRPVDRNGEQRWLLAKQVSTLYQPYSSVAFFLALCWAVRGHERKIGWKAVTGTLGLHGMMFAAVWIDVVHADLTFGTGARNFPDWARVAVAFLHGTVTDWPAGVFLVPLVGWLLLWSSGRPRFTLVGG